MQMNDVSYKKIIAAIVSMTTALVLLYVGAKFLWIMLFHAELTISLEDTATVTVLDSEHQAVKELGEKQGEFTINIASGDYHVQSMRGASKTRKTVALEQSGEEQMEISFKKTKTVNKALFVEDGSVDKIAAGNNTLYAHENQYGYIYYYRPGQSTEEVVSNLKGGGLLVYNNEPAAVSLDGQDRISLHTLKKGKIVSTTPISDNSSVRVYSNPLTSQYVIVDYANSSVNYYENLNDKSAQKIAEFSDLVPEVTFTEDQVLIYYPSALVSQEESTGDTDLSKYQSVLFDTKTNEATKLDVLATQSLNTEAELVYGTKDGIYQNGELIENKQVRLLESTGNGFIFTLNDDVWEYSFEQQGSYLVAENIGGIIDVETIYGELYLLVQDGRNRSVLRVNNMAQDGLLPSNVIGYENDRFRIESNFLFGKKPQLTITTFGIINNPRQYNLFKDQTLEYRKEAREFLTSRGLDLGDYDIVYLPSL